MPGKIEGNEYNELTRSVLKAAVAKTGTRLDPLMRELAEFGVVAHGTLRAVYYDQRIGTQAFVDLTIKAIDMLLAGRSPEAVAAGERAKREAKLERDTVHANADRRVLRMAISAMCHACASPEPDEAPTCWDGGCPLRPVSPLPLASERVTSALPSESKEVARV